MLKAIGGVSCVVTKERKRGQGLGATDMNLDQCFCVTFLGRVSYLRPKTHYSVHFPLIHKLLILDEQPWWLETAKMVARSKRCGVTSRHIEVWQRVIQGI